MLKHLRGLEFCVQILGVAENKKADTISIIFDYDKGYRAHTGQNFTKYDIKVYMYRLLQALDQCHSRGIMHRDIKARNILFNRETLGLKLIDFGLSDAYIPLKGYNPSVCSRHYKSPELLLNYHYYDYAIDVWSAGCIFAGLIFQKDPFFLKYDMPNNEGGDSKKGGLGASCGGFPPKKGRPRLQMKGKDKDVGVLTRTKDIHNQISALASVVGPEKIMKWANKYHIKLNDGQREAMRGRSGPKKGFYAWVNEGNRHLSDPDAIELLSRMLTIDHVERFTARECMTHKYFDEVR